MPNQIRLAVAMMAVFLLSIFSGRSDVHAADPMFGDGSDGPVVFSVNTQFNPPVDAVVDIGSMGNSTLMVSSASGAFVPGQRIMIHQTRGVGAGNWELNTVQSYALGNITTVSALVHAYTTTGASRAQVLVVPEYTSVTVDPGDTVSAKPWNGATGGILAFFANGTLTVSGTISASAAGFQGGPSVGSNAIGWTAEGNEQDRHVSTSNSNPEGSAGIGDTGFTAAAGAGGGGGGNGSPGGQGWAGGDQPGPIGGGVTGTPDLAVATFGGGGAGGSGGNSGTSGPGGAGGGFVFVAASMVTLSGSIESSGGNGQKQTGNDPNLPPGNGYSGGGGGGAGGSVLVRMDTGSLGTGVVAAAGAMGGQGSTGSGGTPPGGNGNNDGGGGAGGSGRIRAEYCTSISGGVANPPASVAQISCQVDSDSDGWSDDCENAQTPPSNPNDPMSTPNKGLTNAAGLATAADADADHILDVCELSATVNTNAADPDTDDDGVQDGVEVGAGTNPNLNTGNYALPGDLDGDGCTNAKELAADDVDPALDRHPGSWWDMYSVDDDDTAPYDPNNNVDLSDTLDLLGHFGEGYDGGAYGGIYGQGYDRTRLVSPTPPGLLVEGNNGIDLTEALANLAQFGFGGAGCVAPGAVPSDGGGRSD